MRHLSILGYYFAQYIKVRLAYPGDFLISVFTSLAGTVASFGFLYILFHRVSSLQGWAFEELLFIYGFNLVCLGLFNVLSMNLYEFGERYIMEGRFDQIMLRPLHSLFQVIFEAFRIESFQEFATGLVVVVYVWHKLDLPLTPLDLVLFLLMTACGVTIYLSVFVMLSTLSFWFEDRVGVSPPVYNMIAFGRYPVTIYNVFIQFLLSWIIPSPSLPSIRPPIFCSATSFRPSSPWCRWWRQHSCCWRSCCGAGGCGATKAPEVDLPLLARGAAHILSGTGIPSRSMPRCNWFRRMVIRAR